MMNDHTENTSHWTRNTPGVNGPVPSKRDSSISLEDPYLVTQEHHRVFAKSAREHQSLPDQQHHKPPLGLLIPQETYHYDPSPLPSPKVDCPPLSPIIYPADVSTGWPSPLHQYLGTPDKNEQRMMGLSPCEDSKQLHVPTQGADLGPSLLFSTAVDASWDMVESPEALAGDQIRETDRIRSSQVSGKTSSCGVVGSPPYCDSSNLNPTSGDSITLGSPVNPAPLPPTSSPPHNIPTPRASRSHAERIFSKVSREAGLHQASNSEPSANHEGIYPHAASSGSSSSNTVDDRNKTRSLKKQRVRLHRFKKQESD